MRGFGISTPGGTPATKNRQKQTAGGKTSGVILAVIINSFKGANVFSEQLRLGESLPGKFQDPGNKKVFSLFPSQHFANQFFRTYHRIIQQNTSLVLSLLCR